MVRTKSATSPVRLADYKAPNFKIESVFLDFDLTRKITRVKSRLSMKRLGSGSLSLDGEDISLKSVAVNGRMLKRSEYRLTQSQLVLPEVPDEFTLEINTECEPEKNTQLMGLYLSGGRYCTQCEAEGFRRITYYLDRPDVLSIFRVKIKADKAAYPFLLSNGNMVESGDLENGQHFAVWEDPFPKPCYLFALVAGEFDRLEDSFTTMSGRKIPLTIFVDPGNSARAEYAMDALIRSMAWDEKQFGREYDLDRFMIVAVRDFNFGAMENKGLNIFNASLLLADEQSATDLNYERIESVVAHEYFHNWSGNRITCRDWFQLCLKEGFTVFRDQEFSADQRGASVQRIKDVRALRTRQFPEDGGPLAHPVRPESFVKIDNFYTSTVYEKGAELVRMIHTILGEEQFRKGCDLYFDELDGQAATVEQFIASFEKSSGQDFSQFMNWYRQAGTPHLHASSVRQGEDIIVKFRQRTNKTPGQSQKSNQVIPIKWQIVTADNRECEPQLTILEAQETEVRVPSVAGDYSLSVLHDFSAPVILDSDQSIDDNLRLMAHDSNEFCRWEAGQTIARYLMMRMAMAIESGVMPPADRALTGYCAGLESTLLNDNFDNNFKALALLLPSDNEILQNCETADPVAVNLAGQWLARAISDFVRDDLVAIYDHLQNDGPFSPDAINAGKRALRNRCLSLLASRQDPVTAALAVDQFYSATNMTDELSALVTLTKLGGKRAEQSLQDFYEKWENTPLVIDKWFAVQASRYANGRIRHMEELIARPAYNKRNPNRVRATLGGFAMTNPKLFHIASGDGYRFFSRQIIDMDKINPNVAARLAGVFEIWRRLDLKRQDMIKNELDRIIAANPSKNLLEIATKTRG